MTEQSKPSPRGQAERFAQQAAGKPAGLLRESMDFLRHNKKWWLIPIVLLLLLVSALVFLTGNPVTAPMMYTMF
ncbi:DUF5989 family protein [Candidatus Thiosymbion oneisti]|uniref:DUF5989 family protein n=1 Tax=Candidatus Thiosymbion oneisti TaxID=589554 RepID=UPI00105FBF25|nr:DUF5989 family protein [Candidatus Thiosymbion oneisti]